MIRIRVAGEEIWELVRIQQQGIITWETVR